MGMYEASNYLSPQKFKLFIDIIPRLHHFHEDYQKPPMTAYEFQMLYKIVYNCALRVSEGLNINAEDFDISHKTLHLPNTKTGWRNCKCSKWKKKKLIKVDKDCDKCHGKGKVRVSQKTSIGPMLIDDLDKFLNGRTGKLFHCHRSTIWKYGKEAGRLAGLEMFEEQNQRSIDGVWTHLFRKSYSKLMEELGASPSLIMLKGRWKPKQMYQTYTKPDLGYLIAWEYKNVKN